jgi:branched-subunit amino acid transport protein
MTLHELGLILGMAGVTFLARYLLFAVGQRVAFPALVRRALSFVPVAVLTAIIVPMIVLPDGQQWRLDWRNASLSGALAAGLVAWRWQHLLASIGTGMAAFFLWRLVFA